MSGVLGYYRPAIVYTCGLVIAVVLFVSLAPRPLRPSIVLITVDSLRADHLGSYGYSRDTSPNIDALAQDGVVFDNAFTVETLSGPSHASMFTSFFPTTHGVLYNMYELPGEAWTLAEMLRAQGYRTAAFVSDWILARRSGLAQGFTHFETHQVPSNVTGRKLLAVEDASYRAARNWLRYRRGRNFFLWLHCQQPHYNYDPMPPWDRKFVKDIPLGWPYRHFETMREAHEHGLLTDEDREHVVGLYDGEIALTDHLLGQIFDELDRHPEPVLVVLTSDHGDLLFEPGEPGHVGHGRGNFYDGAMRIPLILAWRGGNMGGPYPTGHVETLVSSVDLLPTIAELTGAPLPATIEGRSLVELLDGSGDVVRERTHAMYLRHDDRPTLAVRTARHKLIHRMGEDGRTELYDLQQDPLELLDVSQEQPRLVESMTRDLATWFAARPERFSGARQDIDPEIQELLRKGGYLPGGD